MDVSVLMSTYKESIETLSQAVESILKQTYKDFEFIIILDNPNNEEHKSLIEEYQKRDQRICFYINEENRGLVESLNKGLKIAQGTYVCRMDADDISMPDRLQRQKQYLEEGGYDLVGGLTRMVDEEGKLIYTVRRVPSDPEKIKRGTKYNQLVAHPTWFGKRSMFKELEGYRLLKTIEDYDFTVRALISGYHLSNLNEVVLDYRMSTDSISRNNLLEQFLYLKYLSAAYSRGRIVEIDKAKEWVGEQLTERKALRYAKANQYFIRALQNLESHHYLRFFFNSARMVITSRLFFDKALRFVMATYYSR